ncbi:MAG: hypothetical protein WC799_15175 [Desulfobacteraceae bacterium]|jgi:hypothetical protein
METSNINQQFKDDEISYIKRWDKERNEYIANPFPKIGGRLRLAHESNETLSIETEIIRYDEKIAVVIAVSRTSKGCFKGIGMASVERDEKIAHAILELAETRAIARSLRFAGYGIEYCSAEEVSHLGNGEGFNGNHPKTQNGPNHNGGTGNGRPKNEPENNVLSNHTQSVPEGNDKGRLSSKQYKYIQKLNDELGRNSSELDKQCLAMFGTVSQYLSKGDASKIIEHLTAQKQNPFTRAA